MQYDLCRHIKTNGLRCKSPAVTATVYCYFHTRLHHRHAAFRPQGEAARYIIPGQHLQLIPLEDRESVQTALSVVINALALGQLETRRATALLYGLQLAAINSAKLNTQPYAPEVVRSIDPSPEGLDLAQPATIEIDEYQENEDEDENDEDDEAQPTTTNHQLATSSHQLSSEHAIYPLPSALPAHRVGSESVSSAVRDTFGWEEDLQHSDGPRPHGDHSPEIGRVLPQP
jgi:hypothetical protein